MKSLSLSRPWPTLILAGIKPVENRTWRTHHTGPLIIHAAKSWDPEAVAMVLRLGLDLPDGWAADDNQPTGHVGVAWLRGVHYAASRNDGTGCCPPWGFRERYHWTVEHSTPFPFPIDGRGWPGMFDAPVGAVAMVEAMTGWRDDTR